MLLGITKRFTWAVRPISTEIGASEAEADPLSVVSFQRLSELRPRLQEVPEGAGRGEHHQLLRFNLLNLGDKQVTVCAIAVTSAGQEMLRCQVVPPVIVRAGARYPFMLEIRTGLGSEAVDIQVERAPDDRVWVSAAGLPRLQD